MIECFDCRTNPIITRKSGSSFFARLFPLFTILIVLVAQGTARAEEPEDQYLRIYGLIEKGDSLSQRGENDSARTKYTQAQTELLSLKKNNPTWNPKLVTFRLDYLAGRITAMSRQADPTNTSGGAAQAGTATAASSPVRVKLLAAGVEPRKVLRINPRPGDKQILAVTMKISMGMDMAGSSGEPVKIPAIQLTMEATVKDVSDAGDIAYEVVVADASMVDEPGVVPQLAEALKTSLKSLKGFSSAGVASNRGFNKGIETGPSDITDPQARQLMAQMKEALVNLLPPLPEEPVGSGAKWEAELKLKSQGMTIDQTATYQLNSVEGDRLGLSATMVQKAANQKIPSGAMPGLNGNVTKLTGGGSGDVQLDLAQLMPLRARMNGHAEVSLTVTMGGQKQAMTMKTQTEIGLETK